MSDIIRAINNVRQELDVQKGHVQRLTEINTSLRAQNTELLELLERAKGEKGFTCDCGISEEVFESIDSLIARAKGGAA